MLLKSIIVLLTPFISAHSLHWYDCSGKGDSFCEKGDMCCLTTKSG